jgi:Na+/H+ antiporter NhaD/arsenite permease-like protein
MVNFIKQEALFFISLFLMIVFSVCYPFDVKNYLSYIDFSTIRALVGLLLITTALKQSNIFEKIVIFILQKIQTERGLAFLLVFFVFLNLIFTFILMFIDFRILANLEVVKNYMNSFDLSNHQTIFNLSIIISQIISNVPATIFMSEFSKDYQALAYGVNLAGNGLLIGSMANIIALRFYPNSKIYIQFHKYSILFFILSYLFLYGLWRY